MDKVNELDVSIADAGLKVYIYLNLCWSSVKVSDIALCSVFGRLGGAAKWEGSIKARLLYLKLLLVSPVWKRQLSFRILKHASLG